MKAPEKIYLHPDEDGEVFGKPWSSIPFNKHNVEYTRTDAFIEKACGWLKEQDEMIGVSFQKDFLERFQNYMKGE